MKEMSLFQKKCLPCADGTPPLNSSEIAKLQSELDPSWKVVDSHHIEREFRFPDFKQALDFTIRVGGLAEAEGHHPDIHLAWGKAKIILWTHKIKGLSESDFILAAKIDKL